MIRAKLDDGRLPREPRRAAPGTAATGAVITIGMGTGLTCSGCEQPVAPDEVAVTHRVGDAPLPFHEACEKIWNDERRRPDGLREPLPGS
jgi:hypothetical protein